jgi:hypothetical protein
MAGVLLTSCGSDSARVEVRGLLTGVVYSAPTCPVERLDSPCAPRPVSGAAVVAFSGHERRGATRTGADGRFQLALPYGRYTIQATNAGGYPSTASKKIDLRAASASVELIVDSGIR